MEFENVIRTRHATRKFKNERIEKEKLEKVLEAGRLAPTAKNNQPIKRGPRRGLRYLLSASRECVRPCRCDRGGSTA